MDIYFTIMQYRGHLVYNYELPWTLVYKSELNWTIT